MCEQTEISYLDGDVVWVKLGASWWPGQVTSVHNLPEDIQEELKKKPLIAAVKFFQEDTYEFVKNYQQIYKYNCTLKDDFIKKGLDKYRTKSKDGSSYMDKFPGDVEMAEKLTGGDADIISSHKFTRQQKPDISALFGEKKVPKKKRDRDDDSREKRNDSGSSSDTSSRKITHPRFLKESDHEVRIRHQPASLSSTPTNSSGSPQYSCYVCNFTSSRLNVIILHNKTHSSGNSTPIRTKVKTYLQPKAKTSDSDTPKRKYTKKDKGETTRSRKEIAPDAGKRKYTKHTDKANKKKKPDPELREKLLADWEDESDTEMDSDLNKSVDTPSLVDSPKKSQMNSGIGKSPGQQDIEEIDENEKILSEAKKILNETEALSSVVLSPDSPAPKPKKLKLSLSETHSTPGKGEKNSNVDRNAKLLALDFDEKKQDTETDEKLSGSEKSDKKTGSEKDDKKSRLSCFDFDEEDIPEPTIPPVRKIPRVFGDKNLSLKKEIIKEFEMSQALRNDSQNDVKNDKDAAATTTSQEDLSKDSEITEEIDKSIPDSETKSKKMNVNDGEIKLEIVETLEVEKEEESTIEKTTVTTDSTEITMKQPETTTESNNETENVPTVTEESVPERSEFETVQNRIYESETVSVELEMNQPAITIDEIEAETMQIEESGMSPVLAKKRRGRPRKNVHSEKKMIDNSVPVANENKKNESKPVEPAKDTFESANKMVESNIDFSVLMERSEDEDKKPVNTDVEVPQIARKLRVGKKSSKSDVSLPLVDQKTSNDDNQSEIDDSSLNVEEKPIILKKKLKRGRKPLGFIKKTSVVAEKSVVESAKKLSETVEESADSVSHCGNFPKSEEKHKKHKEKTEENLEESVKVEEINSRADLGLSYKSLKPGAITPTKIELESKLVYVDEKSQEPATTQTPTDLSEVIAAPYESGDTVIENNSSEDKDKVVEECKIEEPEVKTVEEEITSLQNIEISKPLETLPPKKSQIKKFELSQIDSSDNNTSLKKTIAHPESESKTNKIEEMEIEITRVSPSEKTVDTTSEKKMIVEQEKVDTPDEDKLPKDSIIEIEKIVDSDKLTDDQKIEKEPVVTIQRETCQDDKEIDFQKADQSNKGDKLEEEIQKFDKNELEIELVTKELSKTSVETPLKRSSMQTRYKGKFTPETGAKSKKEKDGSSEEKPINTFQEAFLKTLQIDNLKRDKKMIIDEIEITVGRGKKGKKPTDKKFDINIDNVNITPVPQTLMQDTETEPSDSKEVKEKVEEILETASIPTVSAVSGFQGVEVVVEENIEIETKPEDRNIDEMIQQTPETSIEVPASPTLSAKIEDSPKALTLDVAKLDDTSRTSMSTPSPTSLGAIPVKKREKPRIIESVALKEPMHILKSKLLEKLPARGTKHKLESDTSRRGDSKHNQRTKIMKIENLPSNSKLRPALKVTSTHLSLTKKLEALKAEEANLMESQTEKVIAQTSQTLSPAPVTEKLIQQSSQSLADMELDINSMPFVLSEDVLTPESIEQMPVVITSLIPSSSSITTASISLTATTQSVSSSQGQFKVSNESAIETTPSKKKSGMPAILKNKGKGKPTITSVKTIVPPLTGGVKGLKFQNAQTGKTSSPLISQKGQPGKYVIVQTSGGQQLRYSVQGKPGTQQKIAIPTGKTSGSAQIVQQGGKVVILTSPQSGQTKMIPLNTSKTIGTKMQRIMTSKGQILTPINPQSVITTKTIIAPKTDVGSPTTSKVTPQGQKILTTSGLSSKGVLTPISGGVSKSTLLGTLTQGILTKGGIYTPISAASLTGKAIISSKGLVTSKGTTILSPLASQGLVTSKGILGPLSQSLAGKTILSTQGIVSSKGTVLTPITGQQVKAIAAKSPSKGTKIQYQTVQQKMQLPVPHKGGQKVPISSQMRVLGSLKSPGSTILLQNTVTGQKTLLTGKKIIKQAFAQQSTQPLPALTAQSGSQQPSPSVLSQGQHMKGKVLSSAQTIQKVVIPRTPGRQTKSQQKIVVQKIQDTSLHGSSSKLGTNVSNVQKMMTQSKPVSSSNVPAAKASAKSYAGVKSGQQKRNLLNVALNSISTPPPAVTAAKTPISLPTLEHIDAEKKPTVQEVVEEVVSSEESKSEPSIIEQIAPITEKIEEPKIAAQPQIMALPTESGDGTQTYVLVTIDEQGQIQPLDNNTLMSLEGTTQNPDGTRTLYIDPSSLGDAGTLDNIVLQFDNGCISNLPSSASEPTQTMISESFPSSEIIQTSNQDILAAALANTDFQQEIGLPENPTASVMTTGLTQTSLINQTILQSTIIPPTEPISSPAVLETSLTLNQPIMTPLEVPSNLTMTTETSTTVVPTTPSSLELPLTVTNPNIAYISAGAARIQIPGNSMPDIGEIMDNSTVISHSETPAATQYLVLPNLDENMTIEAQSIQTGSTSVPTVSYSVSIPESMVLETTPVQTTPSMPIIDDTFAEDIPYSTSIQTSLGTDQSFIDVPVSEMLVSKAPIENASAQNVTVTSEMIVTSDETATISSQESIKVSTVTSQQLEEVSPLSKDVCTTHEVPVTTGEIISQQTAATSDQQISPNDMPIVTQGEAHQEISMQTEDLHSIQMHIDSHSSEIEATSMPLIEETCTVTSKSNIEIQSESSSFHVTDSNEIQASTSYDIVSTGKLNQLLETSTEDGKLDSVSDAQAATSNETEKSGYDQAESESTQSVDNIEAEHMDVEPSLDNDTCTANKKGGPEASRAGTSTLEGEQSHEIMSADSEITFEEAVPETSEETPSQSYEQFDIAMTNDSLEIPSQSVNKSEHSPEPTQSISYESMEVDENNTSAEPPTQSFEDSKQNEASQSYETSIEIHGNTPTQSFNEIMHSQEDRNSSDELIDDQSFPTQSYEVGKLESLSENMETDAEMSQEGNIPSQSNDIGTDGIGTSSISTNNSGANEDETASSSYVPETPENQERDQDQESAISTSSYEIPPCEELNIASSSVIPDTSVGGENTSIHDNGVPEIPTSSYNLNPDSSSTHVDAVPTSSYEDHVILEQNVSTSYEVPISMPGLEENSSQSFVTESSDHRNEPTSYYTRHQEVTASYYESVHQEPNSRLEEDPQEEVTASYYESNPQDIASEASQSYFVPEEATPSYSNQNITPSYYNARPESEATQSFYSSQALNRREQSSSQNVEASQSFYPEVTENLRLRQQGEATPTYSGRYPVDYTLTDSPIERHDLVESSVPATRPTESSNSPHESPCFKNKLSTTVES